MFSSEFREAPTIVGLAA